jgi:hypothetical protein
MKFEKHGTSAWLIHYHKDLKPLVLNTVILQLTHYIIALVVFNLNGTSKKIIKSEFAGFQSHCLHT